VIRSSASLARLSCWPSDSVRFVFDATMVDKCDRRLRSLVRHRIYSAFKSVMCGPSVLGGVLDKPSTKCKTIMRRDALRTLLAKVVDWMES
jgi:hypothetical protein